MAVEPTRFVVYSPDTDEYLAVREDAGDVVIHGWHPHPREALQFDSLFEAEAVAHDLVQGQHEDPRNRKFRVQVCELLESETQFGTFPVAEIILPGSEHGSSLRSSEIGLSNEFQHSFVEGLGIRPAHARAVVERPDRFTIHEPSACGFYIKRINAAKPPRYLLVVLDQSKPHPKIEAAWPIPLYLLEKDPEPLAALKALCEAFGEPLLFRGERTKLVLGETFPEIPDDIADVLWFADRPKNGEIGYDGITQFRVGGHRESGEWRIGWAYSIHTTALMKALRTPPH